MTVTMGGIYNATMGIHILYDSVARWRVHRRAA